MVYCSPLQSSENLVPVYLKPQLSYVIYILLVLKSCIDVLEFCRSVLRQHYYVVSFCHFVVRFCHYVVRLFHYVTRFAGNLLCFHHDVLKSSFDVR